MTTINNSMRKCISLSETITFMVKNWQKLTAYIEKHAVC